MGEIADALRRARAERARGSEPLPATQDVDPASVRPATPPRSAPPTPDPELPERGAAPSTAEPFHDKPEQNERFSISREKAGSWIARTVVVEKSGAAESYRHFALRLIRELEGRSIRSVVIVSALRQEGKTTTSCNLSLAMTSMGGGRRIALVDLDLRRPSMARALGVQPTVGIESVLYGNATIDEVCVPTDLPTLDLYPVASPVHSPHELLAGPPLAKLMRGLHDAYDLVVVDSPPILLVPDTSLILPHVGGCVAVLRSRRTRRETFKQALATIPRDKLLGTLLNDASMPRHTKDYGYYLSTDEEGKPTRKKKPKKPKKAKKTESDEE